jgi:hypothetical protein
MEFNQSIKFFGKFKMKILNIDTKLIWNIHEPKDLDDSFVGICHRLGISVEANTLEKLLLIIQESIDCLFKDLAHHKDINEFCFKHSIAYKIKDYKSDLEFSANPIIIDDNAI